jgi:hypothetical protein
MFTYFISVIINDFHTDQGTFFIKKQKLDYYKLRSFSQYNTFLDKYEPFIQEKHN